MYYKKQFPSTTTLKVFLLQHSIPAYLSLSPA